MKLFIRMALIASLFLVSACASGIEVIPSYSEYMEKPETSAKNMDKDADLFGKTIDIDYFYQKAKAVNPPSASVAYYVYFEEDGKVSQIQYLTNVDEDLANKINDYYSHANYSPAENNGKKVKSKIKVNIGASYYSQAGDKKLVWVSGDCRNKSLLKTHFTKTIDPNVYMNLACMMPEFIGSFDSIKAKLVYPEAAKAAGVKGIVFVTMFINEEGSVDGVGIIKGLDYGCDENAMESSLQLKFKPAADENGNPVKAQIGWGITFE